VVGIELSCTAKRACLRPWDKIARRLIAYFFAENGLRTALFVFTMEDS
jgi:hypothetical protein